MNNKFIVLMIVSLFFACNDAIEIVPEDEFTPEITFESVSDLQQGLNGVYAQYNFEADITYNSIFTDNVKPGYASGGQQIPFFNWLLPTSSGNVTALWNSYYDMINAANRVIEASVFVDVSADEQVAFNDILGQLYGLRAVAHYHLHTYFTTDYLDESALSAIISDRVPVVTEVFARNTTGEMYDFILEDLATASGFLSSGFNNNGFITEDFITGLRARVALLRNDASGIGLADNLIGQYPLANPAEYAAMFFDQDDTEVIFKLFRTTPVGGIWYFTNSAGPFLEASNGLYNTLEAADDVRLGVNINLTNDINVAEGGPTDISENIILIHKYPGNSSPFVNNIKAMRVSEMYLLKAELQVKAQNNLPGAALTLKQLRDARNGADTPLATYANSTEALADVMNERRMELAYEGARFLDIKRNKSILGGISRNPIDCAQGGACELPASDYRFTLPIPQVEVNANPSITQNPGY
ncbi:RagB/SusD family nutrient uptake outer membrane protein [Winogradskyella ursingii]|uniref:RagB/SusD family nutrient uptake outer membrane protein n=1 Tax=Winogradskyella ursingii TaxID=2686079 RepID=UPI0015C754D0|nr:RagB/SusD family nutrient uptake outer membrane protein [Winogradskyella ursingii]